MMRSHMTDEVAAYIEAIDRDRRPLFDRVHGLIMEIQPDVRVILSYKMPTYVVGVRQLHVAAWKHGLSFYGWRQDRDGGFSSRYPHLDNGKGTLKLPLNEADDISDDDLRAFLAGALTNGPGLQEADK